MLHLGFERAWLIYTNSLNLFDLLTRKLLLVIRYQNTYHFYVRATNCPNINSILEIERFATKFVWGSDYPKRLKSNNINIEYLSSDRADLDQLLGRP